MENSKFLTLKMYGQMYGYLFQINHQTQHNEMFQLKSLSDYIQQNDLIRSNLVEDRVKAGTLLSALEIYNLEINGQSHIGKVNTSLYYSV